jgi:hypothetical protein
MQSPNRHCTFVEEKYSPTHETQMSPMQIFDRRELCIIRHARNTLTIRHQLPIYLSRQTLEFSPDTSFDQNSLASKQPGSSPTPASKHPSSRSKSHLGFAVSDNLNAWMATEVAKDAIPREHQGFTVRPCSHNTPRPTSSNSILDRIKGL